MITPYKNSFRKVFLVFLFLVLLIVIDFIWISNTINKGVNISESSLIIAQWLSYALVPLVILAEGLYIYSHYLLAKAKGYSGWLTLLALINTIGLAIIFLLPDRRKNESLSEELKNKEDVN